jgi:hypothetical protein
MEKEKSSGLVEKLLVVVVLVCLGLILLQLQANISDTIHFSP